MESRSNAQLLEWVSQVSWTKCSPSTQDTLQSFLDHWPGYELDFGPEFPALGLQETVYFLILKTLNQKATGFLRISTDAGLMRMSMRIYEQALNQQRTFERDMPAWIAITAHRLSNDTDEVRHRHGSWWEVQMDPDSERCAQADRKGYEDARDSVFALEAQMDPLYFKALVLSHVHGLTHAEIAQKFNKGVRTVDEWIHNGIKQARRILEEKE